MTEQQRRRRAAFVREQPVVWGVVLYAVGFLGCSVATDALRCSGPDVSRSYPYLLTAAITLPTWIALRGWARRVGAATSGE